MISWRVSLSERWSARRRGLAVLDFITTWGHKGLPKWEKIQEGCGVVGQISWESVKGLLSVRHLGENWLLQPQTCPYKRLARPVPALGTPARMPRAGPCQPIREAATRVRDSAVVTPGRTRSLASQREDWASLRAWARWLHARCTVRGVGRMVAAVPEVCQWPGCWYAAVLGLGAPEGSLFPWGPGWRCGSRQTCNKKNTRGGPSFSSAH